VATDDDREPDPLLVRLRAGDRAAFGELVREHRATIVRAVRGYVASDAEAEDVTQQALIKALRAIPEFRGDSSIATWLRRIAVNTAINFTRDAHHDRAIPIEDVEIITNALSTGRMSARQARRKLAAAIVQLPPKQRVVVELRIVHELPFAAIAKIAGCSEDSAKANFRHAVAKLRELSGIAGN
jgi:RNA polymerase sigma-70 factor (ECF subfamily)